jgi:signal transduction histidine kinase
VADRDRIKQVLLNLLSNAIKFCDHNAGWVGVRLQAKEEAVQVDVSDNGPGISEANQRIIFDKFRQVGDTMTEKPQGTGLGLPISRHIIAHFGGELWVTSTLGRGATFSFTLPLEPPLGWQNSAAEIGQRDTNIVVRSELLGQEFGDQRVASHRTQTGEQN